jgi:hypothetical protein
MHFLDAHVSDVSIENKRGRKVSFEGISAIFVMIDRADYRQSRLLETDASATTT